MVLQKKPVTAVLSPAFAVGCACAVLSLLLASLMWQRAGNPAVVLVWLAAAAAVLAYARVHRRWLATFERIAAQRPHMSFRNSDRKWDGRSEEVTFVEVQCATEGRKLLSAPASMPA